MRGRHWRQLKSCRGTTCVGKVPKAIPHTHLSVPTTGKCLKVLLSNVVAAVYSTVQKS